MAEPVIPDELWGNWSQKAKAWNGPVSDDSVLLYATPEAAEVDASPDWRPHLLGVHPRERDARIAAERRAEAAEAEAAQARAFLAERHRLTYCESHRDLTFDEYCHDGGAECPLCQRAKIDGLEARLAEIANKIEPLVDSLMEAGLEDLGMDLVKICGIDIDAPSRARCPHRR